MPAKRPSPRLQTLTDETMDDAQKALMQLLLEKAL